jgi:hypothetical protein
MRVYPDGGKRVRIKKEKIRKKDERMFLGILSCLCICVLIMGIFI